LSGKGAEGQTLALGIEMDTGLVVKASKAYEWNARPASRRERRGSDWRLGFACRLVNIPPPLSREETLALASLNVKNIIYHVQPIFNLQ